MRGALLYQDCRNQIVTVLKDSTSGISAMLATIDIERGTETPIPLEIDPTNDQGNYPEVFVELGETNIEENQSDIINLRDVTQLQLMVILKHGDTYTLRQWGENYIEGFLRIFQNYVFETNYGNFAVLAVKCIRADLDQEQEQTTRGCAVVFNVHRNKLQ